MTLKSTGLGSGAYQLPAADIVAANLADDLMFEDFAATDTDSLEVFGRVLLADVGLQIGDSISAACEIIATDGRRGQLALIFEDADAADLQIYLSQYVAANTAEYQSAALEGLTVPSDCTQIRFRLIRETGVAGGVGARRLSLNKGGARIE